MNKAELETLIYTENKSQREVAKSAGVSEACVSKWMKKHGIVKTPERRWIGKTYGSLTVLRVVGKDRHSHAILECVCECGTKISVLNHGLTSGNTKTCGCKSRKRGNEHPNFRGFEGIQLSHWGQYVSGAKKRGLDFEITMEYAWGIYLEQNRLCALSGQPIYFPKTRKQKSQSTASLDRIDSDKGYVIGNIQWVHKEINRMKSNLHEVDFLEFVRQISEYRNLK